MQVTSSTRTRQRALRVVPSVAHSHPLRMELENILLPEGYLRLRRMLELLAIIITAPVTIVVCTAIAIVIRLDTRGSIIYRQVRVGKNGRRFVMYKFRSMVATAIDEVSLPKTEKNDTRVTRTGRFLRLYRLDEIPQLWNVLRGDMSIIGPRPELPHISADYDNRIPNYRHRRSLPPGITGWAQVHVGYAVDVEKTRLKLDYDLQYITSISPGLDLLVLLKTIPTVLFGRGAR